MKAVGPAALTAVLLFLSTLAVAAEYPPGSAARLRYVSGSVSIQLRGSGNWVAGGVNHPLSQSDNVWTDKDSRAEIGLGYGVVRMNGETSLTLSGIGRGTFQVMLHLGTLNLRVFHLFGGEVYEVDTPTMAFVVKKSGDYRFDVGASGDTTIVTVRKGEGTATGEGPAVRVRAHEQASITGVSLAHTIHGAPNPDGFDSWCQVRDEREYHPGFGPYGPGVIGYPPPYGPWIWVRP